MYLSLTERESSQVKKRSNFMIGLIRETKKLLAAQAHAIEVLNMIEHLEVEMKVK